MRMVLFFTRGISLRTWDEMGIFEREVALYRRLQEHGVQLTFVTYGYATDLRYAKRLNGIRIICNKWRLPQHWYVRLLCRLNPAGWGDSGVLKSNQLRGADVALQVARRFSKRFIARCGYLPSDFAERQHGPESLEARQAHDLEQEVFPAADRVVVTTPAMRHVVVQRYEVLRECVTVIPNYVDTHLFRPAPDDRRASKRICFIGRLDEQKNPFALFAAIKDLDVQLVVVGNGALDRHLRREAETHRLPVQFLGNVPHGQLPEVLKSAALFVLPSHYEGHPKTLLEAMACGVPVIGADVPGIRELICHRETGYLCRPTSGEIRAAIQDVMADADLRARMARNAREYVVEQFALERVVGMELSLLEEVAK